MTTTNHNESTLITGGRVARLRYDPHVFIGTIGEKQFQVPIRRIQRPSEATKTVYCVSQISAHPETFDLTHEEYLSIRKYFEVLCASDPFLEIE